MRRLPDRPVKPVFHSLSATNRDEVVAEAVVEVEVAVTNHTDSSTFELL